METTATAAAPGGWLRQISPRQQFRRWWMTRLPRTDTWTLGQRNIYILPTRAGFTFALTLVVMLVAAINYQLSLGFALTFLLAGAGLVSMHMTHATLRGLTLHLKPPAPAFVGDAAVLEVVIAGPARVRHGLTLRFEDRRAARDGTAAASTCDVPAGGQESTHLTMTPAHRGWHAVPTLVLETVFPFGLFRAWSVWRPAARLLAWPKPEYPPPPLPPAAAQPGPETLAHRRSEGGEFDGVRPWRRGDTMRQVVWKKVARANELVSRETTGSGRRELWLDWSVTAVTGAEARLARLAAWTLAADRAGAPYGLRLPGHELAPAGGAAQRLAALNLLATWA